ncbi:hypothetical protein LWI28_019444 [Acer negundo]|uniref:Uncharacterized protein n=1 Tax=Acer negundo TaxID=4023 RepID=A0AAD5NLY7_ACENE|nr:hypothetical protein LWI28_019444 [Acer negundo]
MAPVLVRFGSEPSKPVPIPLLKVRFWFRFRFEGLVPIRFRRFGSGSSDGSVSFPIRFWTIYNISAIIDSNFHLDNEAYKREGPLYISTLFAMSYGISFACLASTVVHVLLFHGSNHFICQYYKNQLQLPGWAILLACSLALFFTLQVGVINATTNQSPGLNVITEYIIGYIYPGFPVAIMCFKVYGYVSLKQGLAFLQDFKLGHYMKIPPRSMFAAQVIGTIVAALVHLGTAWWLMDTILDICDRNCFRQAARGLVLLSMFYSRHATRYCSELDLPRDLLLIGTTANGGSATIMCYPGHLMLDWPSWVYCCTCAWEWNILASIGGKVTRMDVLSLLAQPNQES